MHILNLHIPLFSEKGLNLEPKSETHNPAFISKTTVDSGHRYTALTFGVTPWWNSCPIPSSKSNANINKSALSSRFQGL